MAVNPPAANSFPQTAADIVTKLNALQAQVDLYMSDPVKFTETTGSSIRVSIPEYIRTLREQINYWQERLDSIPYFLSTDIEGAI